MADSSIYKRYRFPAEIIQNAVWLYFRFNLSHRDIEDLLAQRGIVVSRESIRLWCNKLGPKYAASSAILPGMLQPLSTMFVTSLFSALFSRPFSIGSFFLLC
jgi:hypothetical protein